jgi:tRNA A-37 threonylcarbamoyl transferase component Bud32
MLESLKLSSLTEAHCEILRHSSNTRPVIWVVEEKGVRAIVKDFSNSRFLYRNIIGRFLIWRERRAYEILKGLKGIPACYGVIDGLALTLEQIPSRPLKKHNKNIKLSDTFFDELKNIVDSFHKRGLAHCDLKNGANVLVGRDGRPYIVDWSGSISEKEFGFFPLNRIYLRFVLDDHFAIIKLKMRYAPETVTLEEKTQYAHRSRMERSIRDIRDRLRKILKKII